MANIIADSESLDMVIKKLNEVANELNKYSNDIVILLENLSDLGWKDELKHKVDINLILLKDEIIPIASKLIDYSEIKKKESEIIRDINNLNIPSNW